MKILSTFRLLVTIIGIIAVVSLTGCDKTEDVLAPEDLAPPSNLKALSRSGAVSLYWTASPSAGASSFVGYQIKTRLGAALIDSVFVGKNTTSYLVNSLTNGLSYTFSIRSVDDDGDVSTEVLLLWGPTIRFTAARIFEFASTSPSGLQFSTGSVFKFSSVSPDNRSLIDLWIDGRGNSEPLLKSAHDQTLSTGWRTTFFIETSTSDLDAQVDVPTIGSFRSSPGLTIVPNKVYFAKTQDGNYTRFQVSAVQGVSPDRYVDITIAYNSGTGAWAKQ